MKVKKILFTILFGLFQLSSFSQCPIKGDKGLHNHYPTPYELKMQGIDSLKNRTQPANTITEISIDSVMQPGDDTKRFSSNQYVSMVAYVYEVKYGGPETCNCHDTAKSQLDIHIELVADLKNADKTKRMIVEINRYTRANDKSMDFKTIHALKGKKVKIEGWLFYDEEHKQNSYNVNPEGTNVWRNTCWELHPVLSIKEIK